MVKSKDIDDLLVDIDDPLKDLTDDNTISPQKILNDLVDGTKNLDLKSHITKPRQLAILFTIAKYLKSCKFIKSHNTIIEFIDKYLRYMVSYNRLSRKEIIKALTPLESKITEYIDNKFTTKFD